RSLVAPLVVACAVVRCAPSQPPPRGRRHYPHGKFPPPWSTLYSGAVDAKVRSLSPRRFPPPRLTVTHKLRRGMRRSGEQAGVGGPTGAPPLRLVPVSCAGRARETGTRVGNNHERRCDQCIPP